MLVLTWWIGPHAYGLFVTAIGLVAFLSTLARVGVDTYLVRREAAPDQRLYEIAGTLVLVVSIALALLGAALVHPLVQWLGNREIAAPYLVLLLSVPVIGLTGIPTAKLERELNFRRLAGIEVAGQFLGLVVSFVMAWIGLGVWAAVAGQTTWQVFLLIAACVCARLNPRLRFDSSEARKMLSYGVSLTASLRTWQLRTLVNPLLVGRFAGAEAVAFVALAIRIAEALGSVRLAAGRVAIASLARLERNSEILRRTLEESLYFQVIVLGPLLCFFPLFGSLLIHHVIGSRWMASLAIYPFVAAGVLVNSVYNLQASALFVNGRQWIVMQSYLAHVVLLGAGTYLLLPHFGIAGYGWAELLACVGYVAIHRAFRGTLSYRKVAPWLTLFVGLIFLPLASHNWIAGLFVGLVVTVALWRLAITQAHSGLWAIPRRVFQRLSPAAGTLVLLILATLLITQVQSFAGVEVSVRDFARASETIPPTFFGMHFRMDKIDWPSIPFGALRLWDADTNWQRLNPQPGKYDFAALDRYLAAARTHHLSDVLLTLGSTPAWASSDPADRRCDYADFAPGSCHPPSDLNADGTGSNRYWRDFLYHLGSHLASPDRNRYATVSYFSVWNEFTRGSEAQHPSWLGTDEQLRRMAQDAACILIGRSNHQTCTAAGMHEPAVGVIPAATMVTPDAVPQAPGLGIFATYIANQDAMDSAGIVAVHAYAYGGLAKTFPEAGPFGLVQKWSDIQSILPDGSDPPIWSTEGSWGDTQRNLPDADLQAGYVARYYLVGWSLGFRRLYWYAADSSWGRLIYQNGIAGCDGHGTHAGCPTLPASAWTQVYGWMAGNRMTEPCVASRDIWTCELTKPDGTKLLAVWDASQNCLRGICSTTSYVYPASYTHYFTLDNGKARPLPDRTVQIGWKPILLSQGSDE